MSNRLATTADKIAASVQMDPVIIVAAITAIVNLIGLCLAPDPTPAQIAKAAKYPRRRHRRAMTNAVRRELDSRGQVDKLEATMRSLHGEIAVMSAEELAEICQECSQITADFS